MKRISDFENCRMDMKNTEALNDRKKINMELNELIFDVFQLECKLFMKTNSYRLIAQKCSEKCLDPNERQILRSDIHYVFTRLLKTVTEACPDLTDEDVIFCCLTKSGLDNSIICRCMGNISKKTVNQRKYRIKKKMKEIDCNNLFELIFLDKQHLNI